jgi:hypothetical protein
MAESAAPKTKNPNEVCIVASYSTRGKSGHFALHGSFILEGRYRVNGLIGPRGGVTFLTRDAQHIELADKVAEYDCAVARHLL